MSPILATVRRLRVPADDGMYRQLSSRTPKGNPAMYKNDLLSIVHRGVISQHFEPSALHRKIETDD